MYRLEKILSQLRSKGWQITEADTKTLVAYTGVKVNTTMELTFVDKQGHTIKRQNETGNISAIKVKNVKAEKNASMPRKDDMVMDLIALTKQRIDIIYAVSDEEESFNEYLKLLGFETLMKNINEDNCLKYYCQARTFGTVRPETRKELSGLKNFVGVFEQAGDKNGQKIDLKYKYIISQQVYSDKDLEYIHTYLTIAKKYYEIENKDYANIYDEDIAKLTVLIEVIEDIIGT